MVVWKGLNEKGRIEAMKIGDIKPTVMGDTCNDIWSKKIKMYGLPNNWPILQNGHFESENRGKNGPF